MLLPNPFCGLSTPKGDAVCLVVIVDMTISLFFLSYVFVMLTILSAEGKLKTVPEIVAGLFLFISAILNFVLQFVMMLAEMNISLKGSLIWLILRALADAICGLSLYYLVFQDKGGRRNGLAIILLTPVVMFRLYVWYVILAFAQQLHLDAATAITVESEASSIVRQQSPNSFETPAVQKPKSTSIRTRAKTLYNIPSFDELRDHNNNNTTNHSR